MIGFILSVFRKRRAQRSPQSIPVAVLDLDEAETPRKGYYLVTILLVFFYLVFWFNVLPPHSCDPINVQIVRKREKKRKLVLTKQVKWEGMN